MFCIGILSPAKQPSTKVFEAFREGLRALGYIEGGNITIEYRLAAGDNRQLPVFAGELARLPVDIIVARIFDSASPGDLPIDEPTHFEFVVNLKTAQALGLTIPPSVLDRADKIIE